MEADMLNFLAVSSYTLYGGKGLLYSKKCPSKGQEPFLATNHTKK